MPLPSGTDSVTPADIAQTYIKYYPSQYYETDSSGLTTINVPFNGKMVFTLKYSNDNTILSGAKDPITGQYTQMSYFGLNYQGSPVIISSDSAGVTQTIKRDAWGEILSATTATGTLATAFGFTDHKYDAASDLTYAHARYLSTTNKVFLSEDPFTLTSFSTNQFLLSPQSQNSYSYVLNNPINFTDPTGLYSWAEFENDVGNTTLNIFVPNQQDQVELGDAAQILYETNSIARVSMDHPIAAGAVVGVAGGLAAAGGAAIAPELIVNPASVSVPTLLQSGTVGSAGGVASQAISDVRQGRFSGFKEYGFQAVKGFVTGASGEFGPLAAGISAAGGSAVENKFHGEQVNIGDMAYNGLVSLGLTYGFNQLPQTKGAKPGAFSRSFFTGAHAQRAIIDELSQDLIQSQVDKIKNSVNNKLIYKK